MDSRAQRFEDEKRRIIESCFTKKDVDGSLLETYITHIRITEYSSHPTSPPPPQARTPETQKPRVIIVAVRKSGRVRMHKTKENANGSFSIGKTWNLDDLSAIESFTGPSANPNFREWAGDTGFVVTLGKPYFWNAQSDKEKKFFIASLAKIYGKYTGGKTPELLGFDPSEIAQILRNDRRPPPPGQLPFRPPPSTLDAASSQSNLAGNTAPSNHGTPSPGPPGPRRPPPLNGMPSHSPVGSMASSFSQDPPTLRRYGNQSQESFAPSLGARSEDASSLPPRSRNGMPGSGAMGRFAEQPSEPVLAPPPPISEEGGRPPERKRPPMDPARPQGFADRDLVPAPLISPGMRRDQVAPPPRSTARKNSISQRSDVGSYRDNRPVTPLTPVDPRTADFPPTLRTPEPNGGATPTRPTPAIVSPSSETPVPPAPVSPIATSPPPAPSPAPLPPADEPIPKAPAASVSPPVPEPPAEPEEESRPGLGPMIKSKKSKGDLAGVLWKAASAATAFRPRPGGAGERLRQLAGKSAEPAEGITTVFQPPPRPTSSNDPKRAASPEAAAEKAVSPAPSAAPTEPSKRTSGVPEVKVTVPNPSRPTSVQPLIKEPKKPDESTANEESRKSIVAGNDAKYLASLGVDPTVLDNKSGEFTKWLDYFGWVPGEQMRSRNVEDMRTELERELNKAQAGGWLARFQEEDDRVEAIKRGIDLAVAECEEMENLLTLYSVELSTLSDDIAYIEAQGQGLQVQTANQKLLRKELESLLETTTITTADLNALKAAPLEDLGGLEDIEMSLVTLYKAMTKIDPSLLGGEPRKSQDLVGEGDQAVGLENTDYGKMRIVQEKKEMYRQESAAFSRRLVGYMAQQFDAAYNEVNKALREALSRKVDSRHHDVGRDMLWKYSPLIKYSKDVDPANWDRMIQVYQDKSHPVYKNEFRQVLEAWKRNARKMTADETTELLFTFEVEKQQEGKATTVRKLTVKRSQTLAKSLRSPIDTASRTNLKEAAGTENRSFPYEVFGHVLDDLLPLVEMEQNFIVDFFHATTLEQSDFPDLVAASRPKDRRGGDLRRHRLMEPDRDLARRVTKAMEAIFIFLETEVAKLIEWVIQTDPLQGAGVLAVLERNLVDYQQSNQEFLNAMLQKLHGVLESRFKKFVDEQIRAIEETKVKINKRKGVISFIRVFPQFSNAVENILTGIDPNLAVRKTVDREYGRILKSMFDSLKIIARENPAVSVGAAGADPEDKEALNFHILLIENMNHFLEEVNTHGLDVLEDWREAATSELNEHMGLYLNAVMRRPLGKLLEYIENIEGQLQSGKPGSSIASQPSNSKSTFHKVLATYDAREVRKGIETLRKRVEKHFGDADDLVLSQKLVNKVLRECERFYGEVELRISRITADVYGGDVLFEWPRAEVKAGFR
ncbi:exocyst complex component Sec3 [Colletotrichum navitas]|uniref:Exocyst complex component Sec3 n=1 Tax=Colletotrichum navitas TaxID=681940 RepID=A0AAD8PTH7_9PEZI|nr:exocyst complex component Sec3 [Colletotrichum navitas]KAK1579809.1 exocyst complex component Sec3 [Colletotrichum navitas]